jgi:hypothetical protein
MTKRFLFPLFLCVMVATTGCITSDTLIKLKPDGSGLVIQKTLMSTEMLEQLTALLQSMAQQMAGAQAGQTSAKIPEFFSEKDARARASRMGPGVTFVSSQKIKTESQEGIEATYAFTDITKLTLNEKPQAPPVPGMSDASNKKEGETTFRFSRLPNGHALLTAVFSRSEKKEEQARSVTTPPDKPAQEATPQQLEQAKKLFQGLRIGMAVEVEGTIVRTNSLYQEGARVTLLEMDFSELLSNEAMLRQLAAKQAQSWTLEEAKALLKDLKGFKVNLDPEVQIEIAGQ